MPGHSMAALRAPSAVVVFGRVPWCCKAVSRHRQCRTANRRTVHVVLIRDPRHGHCSANGNRDETSTSVERRVETLCDNESDNVQAEAGARLISRLVVEEA